MLDFALNERWSEAAYMKCLTLCAAATGDNDMLKLDHKLSHRAMLNHELSPELT